MKINRNNLIAGILAFLLVVNILVLFNLNQFYIRAVLAFVFIVTIPGLLIMLMLKIREVGFWEYLVYTIGLSISFIMFGGLAVNWGLPVLGITDKPLALYPILICFDIFLLVFSFVAWYRNKDLDYKIKFPEFTWLDRIFIVVPMLFPILSILGAFLLNNHGTNILTMIMLGGIAVYVLMLVLFRNKLNKNIFPWAILMISLALLLMYSLRSWYISGYDIHIEFAMFSSAKIQNYWDIDLFNHAYNACLSITILPIVLNYFSGIAPMLIFKLFSQVLFSLVPLIIFLISKKIISKEAALIATLFFVSQPQFYNFGSWVRQEIALIFFSLIFLILSSKNKIKNFKILFLIFGFSLIVSHYSSAYIFFLILIFSYFSIILLRYVVSNENKKIKKILSILLIFSLLIFGFLWYSQLTETSQGIVDFTKKSASNLAGIFEEESTAEGQGLFEYFNIFSKQKDKSMLIANYTSGLLSEYSKDYMINTYSTEQTEKYRIRQISFGSIPAKINSDTFHKINILLNALRRLAEILLIVGGGLCLYKKKFQNSYLIIIYVSLVLFAILTILPFVSINYNLSRLLQQFLIIICPLATFALYLLAKSNQKIFFYFFIALFLSYFLLMVGFIPQIIGGYGGLTHLNNFGSLQETSYSYKTEVQSSIWIGLNQDISSPIYSDSLSKPRLISFGNVNKKIFVDIIPSVIDERAYVYLRYYNCVREACLLPSENMPQRITANIACPTEFLSSNKNKIYNNGGSQIFK